jgi:hypothetical protein
MLGATFYPFHPLHLGDLLMVGPVVSILAPNINVLMPVTWVPYDFFHFIIGGW